MTEVMASAQHYRAIREALEQLLECPPERREHWLTERVPPSMHADLRRLLALHTQDSPIDRRSALFAKLGETESDGTATRDEYLGTHLGPYRLDSVLGHGGMGSVYLGERVEGGFSQRVAIKLLLNARPGMRERFRQEQAILANLRHPHIAQLLDGGESEQRIPFLVMEYVQGDTILDWCQQRQLNVAQRVRLMLSVASALAHAHNHLIVHRDIKPSNILITAEGQAKLLDFGIAKLLDTTSSEALTVQHLGPMTPTYAAPEQFQGGPVGVATDIYQFGVLLYQLLCGRLPYPSSPGDALRWASDVVHCTPITLQRSFGQSSGTANVIGLRSRAAGRDLDAILRKAMAKQPDQRYSSMDALSADLNSWLQGRPTQARPASRWHSSLLFLRRHALATGLAGAAILGMGTLTGLAWVQSRAAQQEAERARASIDFIQEVFRSADPGLGKSANYSAAALLQSASEQMQTRLSSHPELSGPLRALIGSAWYQLGQMDRALAELQLGVDALRSAESVPPLQLAAALEMAANAAQRNGQLALSQRWAAEAEALAQGQSTDDFRVRAGLAYTRWVSARDAGEQTAALTIARASVKELRDAPASVRDPYLPLALNRYASSLTDFGDFVAARHAFEESLQRTRSLWGDRHLRTLRARQALAWHLNAAGDSQQALDALLAVGALLRDTAGHDSQDYGNNLYNRGNALRALGRREEAIDAYREAAAVYAATAQPQAGNIGWALWNAGIVAHELGKLDEAAELYSQVDQNWARSMPPDASVYIDFDLEAAQILLTLQRPAKARPHLDRALALIQQKNPADPRHLEALRIDAELASALQDLPRARDDHQQALAWLRQYAPTQAQEQQRWQSGLDRLADSRPSSNVSATPEKRP